MIISLIIRLPRQLGDHSIRLSVLNLVIISNNTESKWWYCSDRSIHGERPLWHIWMGFTWTCTTLAWAYETVIALSFLPSPQSPGYHSIRGLTAWSPLLSLRHRHWSANNETSVCLIFRASSPGQCGAGAGASTDAFFLLYNRTIRRLHYTCRYMKTFSVRNVCWSWSYFYDCLRCHSYSSTIQTQKSESPTSHRTPTNSDKKPRKYQDCQLPRQKKSSGAHSINKPTPCHKRIDWER